MGKPWRFGPVPRLEDPGGWRGGRAPVAGTRGGRCAGRGPPPRGAPDGLRSLGLRRVASPSQGLGGGRVPAPTYLLPFSDTTPTGLPSPPERDGERTKGSLFAGSWGVGVALSRVSRRPLETRRLSAPERRAPSSKTPAPRVGARRRGRGGLFPGGARSGARAAAPGGHCGPRRDAAEGGGSAAGGGGGGGGGGAPAPG